VNVIGPLSLPEKCAVLPAVSGRRLAELRWLTRALVETDHAVTRLQQWAANGGLDRPAPDCREIVVYHGDEPMLADVVQALNYLAPPARDYVLETAAIVGTGWTTRGWAGRIGPVADRARIIVLSGASRDHRDVFELMLHECAHTWLEANIGPTASAAGAMALHEYAFAQGFAPRLTAEVERIESRARCLARIWGAR
jgi:hypothetical protein